MVISYDAYRTFYTVAKLGSFTRAANALMSSQPNDTQSGIRSGLYALCPKQPRRIPDA